MKEKKQKKRLDIGLLYNVIMLLLFIAKTVKSFSKTADEAGPLRPFILAALVVYVLMFAATIIINLNDKKKLKSETGEYKYAANQTKKKHKNRQNALKSRHRGHRSPHRRRRLSSRRLQGDSGTYHRRACFDFCNL